MAAEVLPEVKARQQEEKKRLEEEREKRAKELLVQSPLCSTYVCLCAWACDWSPSLCPVSLPIPGCMNVRARARALACIYATVHA